MSDPQASLEGRPGRSHDRWILVAVGTGTLMSALDSSVVNVILPLLKSELRSTIDRIAWVPTIYLLVVSALLLLFGRLGDLYGHKRVYVAGFLVFLTGSILCAAAQSDSMLIMFRGIQAVGGAMLFANSPAILTQSFSPSERGRVLGIQGMMTYIGLTIGPPLGGWLAEAAGWRAVFIINIPACLLALALVLRHVRGDRQRPGSERFDFVGAALFAYGLVSFMLVLNHGSEWGWTSYRALVLAGSSVASLGAFVAWEWRAASPMLSIRMFANRVFGISALCALVNYACVFSLMFAMPFLLIQGHGLGTRDVGLILMVQPAMMAVMAPFSGALSDRIDPRRLTSAGMILLACGLGTVALTSQCTHIDGILAGLALVGLGVGLFVSPNNNALMGAAPRERQGTAAGVLATARNVGMVMGIGFSVAILTTFQSVGTDARSALLGGVRASLLATTALALVGAALAWLARNPPAEADSARA